MPAAERPHAGLGLVTDWIEFSAVDGPGNRFVVFLQGCGFDCVACHNPHTIPLRSEQARWLDVEHLLTHLRRAVPFLSGVTVSGGEATHQAGFVHELFAAIGADPGLAALTRFVDTNGDTPATTWDLLEPVLDGAMVDLKCLDPTIHHQITGRPNDRVLRSIELLHRLGRLYEVRLLILPGINDDPDLLAATGAWLADVNPRMRLRVIGFRPHGVRASALALRQPRATQLHEYAATLAEHGDFQIVVS